MTPLTDTSKKSEDVVEQPTPSTSTDETGNANEEEVKSEANECISVGKRHLLCSELPKAVDAFERACTLLSGKFGHGSDECAEALVLYGKALLDLARVESGVFGNALKGVPSADGDEEQGDSSQIGDPGKLDESELDEISEVVNKAIEERTQELESQAVQSADSGDRDKGKVESNISCNGDVEMSEEDKLENDQEKIKNDIGTKGVGVVSEYGGKVESGNRDKKVEVNSNENDKKVDVDNKENKEIEVNFKDGEKVECEITDDKKSEGKLTDDNKVEGKTTDDEKVQDKITDDNKVEGKTANGKKIGEVQDDKRVEGKSEDDKEVGKLTDDKFGTTTDDKKVEGEIKGDKKVEVEIADDKKVGKIGNDKKGESEITDDMKVEDKIGDDKKLAGEIMDDKKVEGEIRDDKKVEGDDRAVEDEVKVVQVADSAEGKNEADKEKVSKSEVSKPELDSKMIEATQKKEEEHGEKKMGDGEEIEVDEEEKEGGEEEGESGEEEEGVEAEGDEDGDDEGDDCDSLQLAWETLEVARQIYEKRLADGGEAGSGSTKDDWLQLAEIHHLLGDISMENSRLPDAITDYTQCLDIRNKHLEDTGDRRIAQVYYSLGLAYEVGKAYDKCNEAFESAIISLEKKIQFLSSDSSEAAASERDEILALIPEIRVKMSDAEEMMRSGQCTSTTSQAVASSTIAGPSTSKPDEPAPSGDKDKATTDITHLVRKKRTAAEVTSSSSTSSGEAEAVPDKARGKSSGSPVAKTAKCVTDGGGGDIVQQVNGTSHAQNGDQVNAEVTEVVKVKSVDDVKQQQQDGGNMDVSDTTSTTTTV